MTQTLTKTALEEAHQVSDTLTSTLHNMWLGFVAHSPYLIAGILILLLTWGITCLVSSSSERLLRHLHKCDSFREVVLRLIRIGVIEITWWAGSTPLAMRESRDEVVTEVKAALDKAGIEIPCPYRTLTFKGPVPLASAT